MLDEEENKKTCMLPKRGKKKIKKEKSYQLEISFSLDVVINPSLEVGVLRL